MATIAQEIQVDTDNMVGTLARVTASIKEAGVNIRALSAWAEGDKGRFRIVTEDNDKAIQAIENAGFSARQKEMILIDLKNEVGTLAEVGQKLGDAGINITYCFVSTSGTECLAVFGTEDNAKAIEVL